MKIYIMTDLEGVAGILNFEEWCSPESRYYELAKEFLTMEVNAAVSGFLEDGNKEIVVADGHGPGAINPKLLDSRVMLMRGWPTGFPYGLDKSYDWVAWVGQHAKAGTEYAHLPHTSSFRRLDLSVNGISIGEFGYFAICASELGVRSIFASGDEAFTKEAEKLVPGIETVSVKKGTTPGKGDDLPTEAYGKRNLGAIHFHPDKACKLIKKGALKAIKRAQTEEFGLIKLKSPFKRTSTFRSNQNKPKTISVETHPSSVIDLMNMPYNAKPVIDG
ncbi:MAG: M55 family metallopeptidase [bacterium]